MKLSFFFSNKKNFLLLFLYLALIAISFLLSSNYLKNNKVNVNWWMLNGALSNYCYDKYEYVHFNDQFDKFLKEEIPQLLCETVKPNNSYIKDPKIKEKADFYISNAKYAVNSIDMIWKFTGIKKIAINYLLIIFFLVSISFFFFIINYFSNSVIAFVSTYFSLEFLLQFLSDFRDFSKTPFILGLLFVVCLFFKQKKNILILILYLVLMAFIIGVGSGFRRDIFYIFLPIIPFYLILFKYYNTKILDYSLKFFILIILPILTYLLAINSFNEVSPFKNFFHVLILGFAENFNEKLSLYSNTYSVLPFYEDYFVEKLVYAFNNGSLSKNYLTQSYNFFYFLVFNFCGDFTIRGLKTAYLIISGKWFGFNLIFQIFSIMGFLYFVFFKEKKYIWNIYIPVAILYLCFLQSLQIDLRHGHYLIIIPTIFLSFLFNEIVNKVKNFLFENNLSYNANFKLDRKNLKLNLSFILTLIIGCVFLLYLQQYNLKKLFKGYYNLETNKILLNYDLNKDNNSFVFGTELNSIKEPFYLIFEYGEDKNCINKQFSAKINYFKPRNPTYLVNRNNFDRSIFYKFEDKGKIFIPIFPSFLIEEDIFLNFENLEIDGDIIDCISTISYFINKKNNPIILDMHLDEKFFEKKLYFKNGLKEKYHFGIKQVKIPQNIKLEDYHNKFFKKIDLIKLNNSDNKLLFNGTTKGIYDYYKLFKPIKSENKKIFIIEGKIFVGGLTVGLLNEQKNWSNFQVNLTTQGKFRFLFEVEDNKEYQPVIAHISNNKKENSFEISRFELIEIRQDD